MAELSPAAQAVLDAVRAVPILLNDYQERVGIAAALRAVADQLAQTPIVIGEPLRGNIAKDLAAVHVADIFAIATELENAQ